MSSAKTDTAAFMLCYNIVAYTDRSCRECNTYNDRYTSAGVLS